MNANEKVMLEMIAERLENNGNAIRGIYNLLHTETQDKLRACSFFSANIDTGFSRQEALGTIWALLQMEAHNE